MSYVDDLILQGMNPNTYEPQARQGNMGIRINIRDRRRVRRGKIEMIPNAKTPIANGYQPELDASPEFNPKGTASRLTCMRSEHNL